VLEDRANLVEGDPRKPLDELGDKRTILEVLEQGCDRDACPAEHPSSAHAIGVALDSRAR
jgi:hypothetical protein